MSLFLLACPVCRLHLAAGGWRGGCCCRRARANPWRTVREPCAGRGGAVAGREMCRLCVEGIAVARGQPTSAECGGGDCCGWAGDVRMLCGRGIAVAGRATCGRCAEGIAVARGQPTRAECGWGGLSLGGMQAKGQPTRIGGVYRRAERGRARTGRGRRCEYGSSAAWSTQPAREMLQTGLFGSHRDFRRLRTRNPVCRCR